MNLSSLWSFSRQRTLFFPGLAFALLLLTLALLMWGTGRDPEVEDVTLETGGGQVRLVVSGEHFGADRGRSRVLLSGQALPSNAYLSWGDEEITIRLPQDRSSGLVYVQRGSRRSNGTMVTLSEDLPSLAVTDRRGVGPLVRSVDPVRAQVGEVLTLVGRHFGRDRRDSSVHFAWAGPGGDRTVTPARWEYLSWSDRRVVLRVPDGAATGPLFVRTAQGESESRAFEVPQPLGGNDYTNPRSYAVLVSVEVDRIILPDPPSEDEVAGIPGPPALYLWLSSPEISPAQGPVQLVSESQGPLFDRVDGLSVYRLVLDSAETRRVTRLFLVDRYEIRTDVERLTLSLDMPRELIEEFGGPDDLSPADSPEVLALLRRLVAPGNHPFEVGRRLFRYVADSYTPLATERSIGALELIEEGSGNSRAMSALFVALARGAGLPARIQAGVLVLPGDDGAGQEARRHYWGEFYVPAIGWVPVDPALEAGLYAEEIPEGERLESYFGALDARRIVFSRGIAVPRPVHPDGVRNRVEEHYSLQLFHEELVGNVDSHRTRWYDIEIIGEYPPKE
ncbi:MAG: transglutaminase domain-containing protein [Spirochaetaceae bacterium]